MTSLQRVYKLGSQRLVRWLTALLTASGIKRQSVRTLKMPISSTSTERKGAVPIVTTTSQQLAKCSPR